MPRPRFCALLCLLSLVASVTAEAREVELSIENRIRADSNVFRTEISNEEVDDGSWLILPRLSVRDDGGQVSYDFTYRPIYEAYFQTGGINGWDHTQRGRLEWRVTDLDTVGFSENFSYTRSVREELDGSDPVSGVPLLEESDREKITRSYAEIHYSRQWHPKTQGRLMLDFDDVDFSDDRSNLPTRAYGLSASINHVPRERWNVGLAALGRWRRTEGVGRVLRQNAYIGNIGVTLAHKFTETIDLSIQAGPTMIWSKRRFEDVDLDTTFFASAELQKSWERGRLVLNYSRRESASGGDGSAIIDSVSLQIIHRPIRRLQLSALFSFGNRDSTISARLLTGGVGSATDEVRDYAVSGFAQYEVTPRIYVAARLRYQEIKSRLVNRSDVANILYGSLSLNYVFEPWTF